MTKEAHDVVNLIINDISKDEFITWTDRVKTLLDIVEVVMNADENVISKEEGLGLQNDSIKLMVELRRKK